jgi:hypothetical protein
MAHFRDFSLSLSEKPVAQDEADKMLEHFMRSAPEDTTQKCWYLQNLIVKYNVIMPNVGLLKSEVNN